MAELAKKEQLISLVLIEGASLFNSAGSSSEAMSQTIWSWYANLNHAFV